MGGRLGRQARDQSGASGGGQQPAQGPAYALTRHSQQNNQRITPRGRARGQTPTRAVGGPTPPQHQFVLTNGRNLSKDYANKYKTWADGGSLPGGTYLKHVTTDWKAFLKRSGASGTMGVPITA
jgi:hypothetical protein